jgi:hypothetical protein
LRAPGAILLAAHSLVLPCGAPPGGRSSARRDRENRRILTSRAPRVYRRNRKACARRQTRRGGAPLAVPEG